MSSQLFFLVLILALSSSSLHAQLRCPPGQIDQDGTCVECPVGTFRKNSTTCQGCRPGTFQSNLGAVAWDLCRVCTPGTYSDQLASPTCKPCPSGTTSNFAATECSVCGPGTAAKLVGTGCKTCEADRYSSGVNNQECEFCPRRHTSYPGSKSIEDCRLCKPGSCDSCGRQAFLSPERDRCIPCPPGTFTSGDDATKEEHCIPCPQNTFNARGARNCRKCKDGTFTNGPGATVCRTKGDKCANDFFENENGDCIRCGRGFKYLEGENRCERCPTGFVSKGGKQTECIKCEGDMLPDFYNRICGCPAGKFYVNQRLCKPCPPGADITGDRHTFRECFPCTEGTFKPKSGTEHCERCPFGMVALQEGSTKCTTCPSGTMPDMEFVRFRSGFEYHGGGTQCVSTKTGCPLGYKRVPYARPYLECMPVECKLDTPKEDINVTCAPCKPGFRLINKGKECGHCPKREVSDGGIITSCKMCENGLFQDDRDPSKCSCYGFFALGFGLQNGKCQKCPRGTFGALTSEKCVPCPPGTFAEGRGNERCKVCAVGKISGRGAFSCEDCPKGKVPNRRFRATKCVTEK